MNRFSAIRFFLINFDLIFCIHNICLPHISLLRLILLLSNQSFYFSFEKCGKWNFIQKLGEFKMLNSREFCYFSICQCQQKAVSVRLFNLKISKIAVGSVIIGNKYRNCCDCESKIVQKSYRMRPTLLRLI